MRDLLELVAVLMLATSAVVVGLALGLLEGKAAARRRVQRALAAVVAARPTSRLGRRVRRAVLLELADLFQRDTFLSRVPAVEQTAAEARRDLRSRRWLRRARGLRTLLPLDLSVEELLRALGDRDPRVRAQAAIASGGRGEPEVLGALVALLQDPQPYVRFTALDAVTRRTTGTAAALAAALDATPLLHLEHLPESERALLAAERQAAAVARTVAGPADEDAPPSTTVVGTGVVAVGLARTGAETPGRPGTLPRPLRATTVASTSTRTLLLLLRGAGTTTDVTALGAVRRFLGDARAEVRAATVEALAALGAAADELLPALEDADGRVRAAAATALGRSGKRAVAGRLAGALADRDHSVRQASAAALAALGPAGRLLLQQAVSGTDRYAADAARSALGLPPEQA